MKLDPIDAIAETVMRLQFGQMPVGEPRQFLRALVSRHRAERLAAIRRPEDLARDGLAQHGVAREGVEAGRGRRLIEHAMGGVALKRGGGGHDEPFTQRMMSCSSQAQDTSAIRADIDAGRNVALRISP